MPEAVLVVVLARVIAQQYGVSYQQLAEAPEVGALAVCKVWPGSPLVWLRRPAVGWLIGVAPDEGLVA